MTKDFIVIIDDEKNIRLVLQGLLSDEGYKVKTFPKAQEAIEFIKHNPVGAVLLDIWLHDEVDGIKALEMIRKLDDGIQVIMMSGHGTIDIAVQCIKQGAYDFLEKPFASERVFIVIDNALKLKTLKNENQIYKSIIKTEEKLLGNSKSIIRTKEQISKIAKTSASVMITGENGTGKELVARSIHELSNRSDKAFISINCAAIPNTLLESEFFGYEKGAFTGADKKKIGKLEMADEGTLFLDEIGDMDMTAQSKILKVIENGEFARLGGLKNLSVNIRFICATNKDLNELVKNGQFREDLFFRLNVIPLDLPPLRERKDDIQFLMEHFIGIYSKEHKKRHINIDREAVFLMEQYHWPGNVRELKNYIERLVILTGKDYITKDDLLPPIEATPGPGLFADIKTLREAKEDFERYYLKKVLNETDGNVSKAADILSIERTSLHRKIKLLNI